MAIIIRVSASDESISDEPKKVVSLTKQQHNDWIEWYTGYNAAVRRGEQPEYRSRDSFSTRE